LGSKREQMGKTVSEVRTWNVKNVEKEKKVRFS
jgi:hypothetical protein